MKQALIFQPVLSTDVHDLTATHYQWCTSLDPPHTPQVLRAYQGLRWALKPLLWRPEHQDKDPARVLVYLVGLWLDPASPIWLWTFLHLLLWKKVVLPMRPSMNSFCSIPPWCPRNGSQQILLFQRALIGAESPELLLTPQDLLLQTQTLRWGLVT